MTYVSFNEGNRRRFCQRSLSCGHPVRSFVSGEINAAPKQWIPPPAMRGFGGRAANSRRGQRGRAGKERRPAVRGGEIVWPKSHVVISISNYPIPQRPQPVGLASARIPLAFPRRRARAILYPMLYTGTTVTLRAIVRRLSTAESEDGLRLFRRDLSADPFCATPRRRPTKRSHAER